MIQNVKNRFNHALANNESGDIPIATIGFIFLGVIVVLLIWSNWNAIADTVRGWFRTVSEWNTGTNGNTDTGAF